LRETVVFRPEPQSVHELLNEVPLYVEDHPPRKLLDQLGMEHRWELCGLYTGIPLTQRHIDQSGVLSDVIHLYREGVLSLAVNRRGEIDERELRHQIRLTILHELGHHHGLDEDELEELGY
jgi:predicted Zn-dependent protease with MMP-like domain